MAPVTPPVRRVFLATCLVAATAVAVLARPQDAPPSARSLEVRLTALRDSAKLPAVAGAVFTSGQLLQECSHPDRSGARIARGPRVGRHRVQSEILSPAGLSSAGSGPPGAADALAEPRGHRRQADSSLLPVEPGVFADDPPFLGPAGHLHMTIADLARWGQEHLRGERGADGLVKAATFQYLHRPPAGGDYALGWVVRTIGGRRVIWHNGSNTLWYAAVAFDPVADRGVALATNGSIGAQAAIEGALAQLLGGS